jgi:hypothetical protein
MTPPKKQETPSTPLTRNVSFMSETKRQDTPKDIPGPGTYDLSFHSIRKVSGTNNFKSKVIRFAGIKKEVQSKQFEIIMGSESKHSSSSIRHRKYKKPQTMNEFNKLKQYHNSIPSIPSIYISQLKK